MSKEEDMPKWQEWFYSCCMLATGAFYSWLPFATWSNSRFFAVVFFLVGLPMGLFFALMGGYWLWNLVRGKDW